MHSRIFQIEKEPVLEDDYISEYSIPDWFTEQIADYVNGDCDRNEDIDWLMSCGISKFAALEGDKLTFTSDIRGYFKEKHEEFVEAAQKLAKVPFDDFVNSYGVESTLFNLRSAYEDEYSFYICSDDHIQTMDSWMRTVQPGEVYYFGGVVDYHF